jgi:hypothetical protein
VNAVAFDTAARLVLPFRCPIDHLLLYDKSEPATLSLRPLRAVPTGPPSLLSDPAVKINRALRWIGRRGHRCNQDVGMI